MGFWNRGSSEDTSTSSSTDFTSSDETTFSSGQSFSSAPTAPSAGAGGDFQQVAAALQQQVMVQTVVNNLSTRAFERCITSKPSESLRSSELSCIEATVGKWMDTNEFMMGRLAQKGQKMMQDQNSF